MNTAMAKTRLLIVGALLLLLLAGCSNEATDSSDGTGIGEVTEIETVYIGALFPSSGAQAELIDDLQTAMLVAAELINESHDLDWDLAQNAGLAGYGKARVEIIFADCGVTAATAREAAERLIDQGVSIITGCYDPILTEAVAEVCQQREIPMICGSARSDRLTDGERGFARVFNHIGMSAKEETELFLHYLNQYNLTSGAGISSAAIAYINNETSTAAAEYLETRLNESGLDVVAVVGYDASSSDFVEPASKMIANAPDVIFQISSTGDLTGMAEAYHGAAFTPAAAFCYSGGFQQAEFLQTARQLEENFYNGILVCPDLLYDDGDPENEDAREQAAELFLYIDRLYREQAQHGMDSAAYLEFASIIVAAQAVEAAGTTDAETLIATLKETTFSAPYLFSGAISFNGQGQNTICAGYVALIEDGVYRWVFSELNAGQNSSAQ